MGYTRGIKSIEPHENMTDLTYAPARSARWRKLEKLRRRRHNSSRKPVEFSVWGKRREIYYGIAACWLHEIRDVSYPREDKDLEIRWERSLIHSRAD